VPNDRSFVTNEQGRNRVFAVSAFSAALLSNIDTNPATRTGMRAAEYEAAACDNCRGVALSATTLKWGPYRLTVAH